MNKNFKVVFSKARNALMVVNEATASVQHKGAKTVIAAAVAALVAGTAAAAEWKDAPAAGDDTLVITEKHVTDEKDQSLTSLTDSKTNNVYTLSFDKDSTAGATYDGFFSATGGDHVFQKGQSLWVTGTATAEAATAKRKPQAYGLLANAGTTVTNEGAIYVSATGSADSWSQKGMMADFGGTAINQGVIVAKNGYGMTVGSSQTEESKGSTITNGANGDITVIDTGVGMELGAADSSVGLNQGVINVGAPSSAAGAFTHGIQIKDSDSNTFTNEGTINAQNGTTAINVEVSLNKDGTAAKDGVTTENNQIVLTDGSTVNGLIRVGKFVEDTTIQINDKAVVNGNLELSGTTTKVIGSNEGSDVNGNLLILAGDTTTSGNLTVQDVAVSAGASFETTAGENNSLTLNSLTVAAKGEKDTAAGKAMLDGKVTIKGDSVNNGEITDTESTGAGNLQIAGGNFQNVGSIGTATNLYDAITVAEGASLTNTGLVYVNDLTVAGTVTSGMFVTDATTKALKNHVKFEALTLEQTGKFVVTNEDLEAETGLTFTDGTINLKGGQFYLGDAIYDGAVTVGGKIYLEDGEYAYTTITMTAGSTVTQTGGKLTVGTLTVGNTATFDGGEATFETLDASKGEVSIEDGNVTVSKTLKTQTDEFSIASDGVLNVAGSALGFSTTDGKLSFTKATDFNTIQNAGTINVTGVSGEMTKDALTTAINGIQKAYQEETGLVDLGAVTVSDIKVENGEVGYSDVSSLTGVALDQLENTTVTGVNGGLGGSFGSAELASGTTTLTVSNTLQLNGSGNLVSTSDGKLAGATLGANTMLVTTGSNAVIGAVNGSAVQATGTVYAKSGSLDIQGDAKVTELAVADGAALTMSNNGEAGQDNVVYNLTADSIWVDGTLNVEGKVTLSNTGDTSEVLGQAYIGELAGDVNVGATDVPATGATLVVGKLTSGKIFADPEWVNGELSTADASKVIVNDVASTAEVEAGQASLVGVGPGATVSGMVSAFEATGYTLGVPDEDHEDRVKAVLYANAASVNDHGQTTYTTIDGNLLASGAANDSGTVTNVNVNADTMLLVDANGVDRTGTTAVFEKSVTLADGSVTYIANARVGDEIKLANTVTDSGTIVDLDGGRLLDGTVSNGVVAIDVTNDGDTLAVLSQLHGFNSIVGMYTDGADMSSSSARFNRWLMSESNGLGSNANVVKAGNDVAAIGATAGMASVTMDALSAFNDTVAARTNILAAHGEGVNVWADINGGRYEAKKLMDGAGYSSDIYAGVIGVDTTVPCGAVVGLALTVGTADTDSKNTSAKTSMDSDLFGISVYTSKTFADTWNVAADFGYLQASNDVSVNAYGLDDFSADTDAFTFGLRGEALAKAGSFNIVPHIGFRWTRISVDSFESGYTTDIDDMNVFQMPVGVTVSGEFDMSGVKVAPMFDLSVVPAFGDKDAAMDLGIRGVSASDDLAVKVIDSNPVQATLGVNATAGAWNFGLNYKLGAGSDERLNNSFNLNARYTF